MSIKQTVSIGALFFCIDANAPNKEIILVLNWNGDDAE